MKLKRSIVLLLSILLTACGNSNLTVAPRHPGQEIVFQVVEGSFTYLKIEGTDPNAKWKTWQTNSKAEQKLVKTDEYWWAGTVVLIFDVVNDGRHSCVIDNLLEDTISDIAVIRYFKGKGCTGEGGSAREYGSEQVLFEYMEARDGLKILDEADKAYNGLGCVTGIVDGFTKGLWGKVMVVTDCVGASMSVINGILSKYKLEVTDKPIPTEPPVPQVATDTSVSAMQGWQSTQLLVEQGTELVIEVISGQWTYWQGNMPYNQGEGDQSYICSDIIPYNECTEPLPDFPKGALIGKVGNQVFGVGNKTTITIHESGTLYLRINDDDGGLFDNDGTISVKILVSR